MEIPQVGEQFDIALTNAGQRVGILEGIVKKVIPVPGSDDRMTVTLEFDNPVMPEHTFEASLDELQDMKVG